MLVGSILLALLVIGSGFGYLYSNRPQGTALPDPEIPQHTAALAAALSGSDPPPSKRCCPPPNEHSTSANKPICPASSSLFWKTKSCRHTTGWRVCFA